MNFKDTFLQLTSYTFPFGTEKELEPFLPTGWKKDSIGNYFYEIGNSETLFTSHLDTACSEREKVNHVLNGDIIKTDGTTILGGDNKAGCVILFYLIEKRVPGTYYFFLGEEMSVHKNYPYGSLLAIEDNSDFFKKFKRVVSFDRKETGQMIVRQLGRNCCSNDFADALISEFQNHGVEYVKDRTGYYTDSAFFGDLVSEIVNLSCGVWNEHTKNEWVDIAYIQKVAEAASKIKWEELPVVRKVESKYQIDTRKDITERDVTDDAKLFGEIFNILDELYYVCHEFRSYQNFLYNFKSGRVYNFTKWHEDEDLSISVDSGKINCNGTIYDNLDSFKTYLGIDNMDPQEFSKMMISQFQKSNGKLTDAQFHHLMYLKSGDKNLLSSNLKSMGWKLNQIGKGWEIIKESRLIKSYSVLLESKSRPGKRRVKKFKQFTQSGRVKDAPYTYTPVGNVYGPNPVPVVPIVVSK